MSELNMIYYIILVIGVIVALVLLAGSGSGDLPQKPDNLSKNEGIVKGFTSAVRIEQSSELGWNALGDGDFSGGASTKESDRLNMDDIKMKGYTDA